jgi:hypothetical protein
VIDRIRTSGTYRREPSAKDPASRAGIASPRDEVDRHAALRKAWEGAKALRGLWETVDDATREWFVGAILFESDETDEARQARAGE